ncbi:phenylacetaldehyde reductase-like isoform X1 [Silene latifolia]|uniref:phenylacetaldehyde reductase-like isoform X1 n=1 Tax=Silene latifolia TaxID=37657 RepID=UPI003D76CFC0
MSGEGKVVCVTGASGYIASWLVKFLLLRGYTVHAALRSPDEASKTKHLRELEGAKERLHLFKADLLEEGSFDAAIFGCHAVFHTASPVIFNFHDPQTDVLDPAIKGTLNVLTSCSKAPSVTRVILTSSIAAVVHSERPRSSHVVVDETWFSDPDFCKKKMKWYALSKTLAEEAAWRFAKENNIDLISINPGVVLSPMLQPTLNESVAIIAKLINGTLCFSHIFLASCFDTHIETRKTWNMIGANATFDWVDIKDVAIAHILALEVPSAQGRYCLVDTVAHMSQIVEMLRQLYPSLTLPNKCADDKPLEPTYKISKEKSQGLGIEYTPTKVSLRETLENLKAKGFISL